MQRIRRAGISPGREGIAERWIAKAKRSIDSREKGTDTISGGSMNWFEKRKKELGYKGCKNCKYRIEVLRTCKWMESGGDGVMHLICPRWEKK